MGVGCLCVRFRENTAGERTVTIRYGGAALGCIHPVSNPDVRCFSVTPAVVDDLAEVATGYVHLYSAIDDSDLVTDLDTIAHSVLLPRSCWSQDEARRLSGSPTLLQPSSPEVLRFRIGLLRK